MLIHILKAILIGICASIPPGPVCVLVMQRTFSNGRAAGLASGFGSAVTDTFYALISIFTVMAVQDFIIKNEKLILITGGAIVLLVGWTLLMHKPPQGMIDSRNSKSKMVQYSLQAAGCALANPGALAYMFALVALLSLDSEANAPIWATVLAVLLGACIWWFVFVFASDKLRAYFRPQTMVTISKICGVVVMVFGVALAIKGLVMHP